MALIQDHAGLMNVNNDMYPMWVGVSSKIRKRIYEDLIVDLQVPLMAAVRAAAFHTNEVTYFMNEYDEKD